MQWQLVGCDNGEPLYLQYQTAANPYWTSLWVRNPTLAIGSVEVKSNKYASFKQLRRGSDGTFNDDRGFGEGAFTLRVTSSSGAVVEIEQDDIGPGALRRTSVNFPMPP